MSSRDLTNTTGARFERAVEIMAKLRGPGGCPWDREQTFDTIKPYTVEETYEVLEAIDNRDWRELPGELGDLLLQVLFYSQMAGEEGRFSIDDVLDRLNDKLVRRHPHVFGTGDAATSADVLRNWEALKAQEKKQPLKEGPRDAMPESPTLLGGVSTAMPALLEAKKLSSKAAGVGFDWRNVVELMEKLREESTELEVEIKKLPGSGLTPVGRRVAESGAQLPNDLRKRLEGELGDLFFVLVNIARHLSLDSESALKQANRKFRQRFREMERAIAAQGRTLDQLSQDELELLWKDAKKQEQLAS
jgi:MazG family protein